MGRTNNTSAVLFVLLVMAVLLAIIWWHWNYKCVSSHHEWRQDCDTHHSSDGKRSWTTCRDRRVDVCDEWEPR